MKKLQYFISLVWGFLTPVLALDGAQQILARTKGVATTQGQATVLEYMILFLLTAGGCILVFLLFNLLYSRFLLPKDGKRFRHFLLNLILYAVLVPAGWGAVMFVAMVLKL